MKKFKFRLERVLQYRQLVKKEKLRDLIKEQMRLQQHLNQLAGLEESLQNAGVEDGTIILAQDVKALGEYVSRLRSEVADTIFEIEECNKRVAIAQKIYQEAARDAEALEKLKSRKSEEYQNIILKEEEKFLDELSVSRYEVKTTEGVE